MLAPGTDVWALAVLKKELYYRWRRFADAADHSDLCAMGQKPEKEVRLHKIQKTRWFLIGD
jgi:hypothetical protein